MSAHAFVPRGTDATRRVQCAVTGCYLTPDEHLAAMAKAVQWHPFVRDSSPLKDSCALCDQLPLHDNHVATAPRKRGRPIRYTRAERKALGLRLCDGEEGTCPRAPSRGHRMCPLCYLLNGAKAPEPTPLLGPVEHHQLRVPVALANKVEQAARRAGISEAEWWRRAAAEKLGQTPARD